MTAADGMNRQMLTILALDHGACLRFSEYTGQWYVAADIEISNHEIISGITEHGPTPDVAITHFLDRLQSIGPREVVVTHSLSKRREWRWNGAAWVELEAAS